MPVSPNNYFFVESGADPYSNHLNSWRKWKKFERSKVTLNRKFKGYTRETDKIMSFSESQMVCHWLF